MSQSPSHEPAAPRLVATLAGGAPSGRTKHYLGSPPHLTGGDQRIPMGVASVLVIEQKRDGVFLYRCDGQGRCVGDTWHMSVEDAKHQAGFEYAGLVGEWREAPASNGETPPPTRTETMAASDH